MSMYAYSLYATVFFYTYTLAYVYIYIYIHVHAWRSAPSLDTIANPTTDGFGIFARSEEAASDRFHLAPRNSSLERVLHHRGTQHVGRMPSLERVLSGGRALHAKIGGHGSDVCALDAEEAGDWSN